MLGWMQEFIPNRSITTRPYDPKWWTPECTNAVKAKDTAWKRWLRNKDDGLKQHFVLAISQAANAIATAKSAMQARIRTKLAFGSLRDKEWWSTLKSATGSSRESSIPLLIDSSGRECHSSQEKSECFAEYFSRKCSLGNEDLRAGDLPALMAPDYPPLFNVRFRVQIVMQHLARLDPSKAAGPDGITGRVLKECCRELAEPVARLYSLSFCCGIVPTMWKLAPSMQEAT